MIEHSDDWDQVRAAFAAALSEIGYLKKDQTANIETKGGAKFAYSYVDLTDVLAEVKRVCGPHDLVVSQIPTGNADGQIEVHLLFLHGSGEWMVLPPVVLKSPADAQAFGSALTYLKRYQLVSVFDIPTGDDDGAEATRVSRNTQQFAGNRTADELAIKAVLMQREPAVRAAVGEAFNMKFHVGNIAALPEHRHAEALLWLTENIELIADKVRDDGSDPLDEHDDAANPN